MNNMVENVGTNHRLSKFECRELEQAILLVRHGRAQSRDSTPPAR